MAVHIIYCIDNRLRQEQRENCHKALEKTREAREKQNLMYAKLKPLSPTKTPGRASGGPGTQAMDNTWKKTEGGGSVKKGRGGTVRPAVAEETRASIDSFEARLSTMPLSEPQTTPSSSPQQTTTTTTSAPHPATDNVSGRTYVYTL